MRNSAWAFPTPTKKCRHAYDKFGTPLPEDTIEACKASDGVLFGAVGGDKWDNVDPALRPEKAILGLRKNLGLYANLRPVKVADALVEYSPLKPELVKGVDLVIVREPHRRHLLWR